MNASTANGTKNTQNNVDHSRSFKYALNSCDCKMYKFTIPCYSCSWTQHICRQQTAGNHKPGLDPVLDKRKLLWELHQAAAHVSRRQHCERLYGTGIEIFCGLCCLRTQMHVELLTKVALLKNSEEVPEVTLWIVTEPWDLCRYSWSVEENEKNVCNITKKKRKGNSLQIARGSVRLDLIINDSMATCAQWR